MNSLSLVCLAVNVLCFPVNVWSCWYILRHGTARLRWLAFGLLAVNLSGLALGFYQLTR